MLNPEEMIMDNNQIELTIKQDDISKIKEIIDKEVVRIENKWKNDAEFDKHKRPISEAIEMLDNFETELKSLLDIGMMSIKYNKIGALKLVLNSFNKIASFSNSLSGYIAILSIPRAAIHNFFYYLGIYSLYRFNPEALCELIPYKIKLEKNDGGEFSSYIWSTASIFTPPVLLGATKMFDRLRKEFKKNETINKYINIDDEKFLAFACQFNMLFCLFSFTIKDNDRPWAYPNFGRFYEERVSALIISIKNKIEYKEFIKKLMNETMEDFARSFNSRIAILREMINSSNYFWDSITTWQ